MTRSQVQPREGGCMEQVNSGHYQEARAGRSEVTNTCRTQKNGVIQLPSSTPLDDILTLLNGGAGGGAEGQGFRRER